MASVQCALIFAAACVCAFGLSDEGCKTQVMEGDAALSLLQSSAHKVKGRIPVAAAAAATARAQEDSASGELAYMNVIRHGEKCLASGEYLLPVGFERADYIGRCMGQKDPSIAMPFGRPTAILVGTGYDSIRPMLTALPLGERLNLTLNMPCGNPLAFGGCIAKNIPPLLSNGGTLIVVDVYQIIPYIIEKLNILGLPFDRYKEWPKACPSSTKSYTEPACCAKDLNFDAGDNTSFPFEPASLCFDEIWQVKWTRPAPHSLWVPQGLTKLQQGFGGTATCPCLQDLAPIPPKH